MWNLSQEIAENYVLRFKENENKKEDPYYRNIQSRLKDIQKEASEILFQLHLYDLAHSAMEHYKHHGSEIPEDIVSIAFRRFMSEYGGRPKDYAMETRNPIAFTYLDTMRSMIDDLDAYNFLIDYGMNEAYTAYTGRKRSRQLENLMEKRRQDILLEREAAYRRREDEKYRQSNVYRISKIIAYLYLAFMCLWLPYLFYQRSAPFWEYLMYFLLVVGLVFKNKWVAILYGLFFALFSFTNAYQSILQLIFQFIPLLLYLIFLETHYFEGRHLYALFQRKQAN